MNRNIYMSLHIMPPISIGDFRMHRPFRNANSFIWVSTMVEAASSLPFSSARPTILCNPAHSKKLRNYSGQFGLVHYDGSLLTPQTCWFLDLEKVSVPSNPSNLFVGWFGFRINVQVWLFSQPIASNDGQEWWLIMIVQNDGLLWKYWLLRMLALTHSHVDLLYHKPSVPTIFFHYHLFFLMVSTVGLWLDITCRSSLSHSGFSLLVLINVLPWQIMANHPLSLFMQYIATIQLINPRVPMVSYAYYDWSHQTPWFSLATRGLLRPFIPNRRGAKAVMAKL